MRPPFFQNLRCLRLASVPIYAGAVGQKSGTPNNFSNRWSHKEKPKNKSKSLSTINKHQGFDSFFLIYHNTTKIFLTHSHLRISSRRVQKQLPFDPRATCHPTVSGGWSARAWLLRWGEGSARFSGSLTEVNRLLPFFL